MVQPLGKTVWQLLTKLNSLPIHSLAITLWGTNPDELGTQTYIQMFIAVLPITAQTWKQPRYPLIGEWMNELLDIQTMKYYSMVKINEPPSQEKTQRNLKCILLNERGQFEKATYCMVLIL